MRAIVNYAKATLRKQYEGRLSQEDTIEEWTVNEAYNDPDFYRWLFGDDTVGSFGSNLSDEEREMASNFFKTL